jgi:hypothetical protein
LLGGEMVARDFLCSTQPKAYSNSQITAIVSNSSTTGSGTVSAYGAGNVAFGEYSGSSNTTGWTAAQQNHSARFVVVKYL